MTDHARRALEGTYDSVRIVRQLHAVPPHEVYEVVVDGDRAVYKGNVGPTGTAGVEGRVQAFVDATTTVPVPTVMHVGDDHFVAAYDERAPDPAAEPEPTVGWARAAGRALATLHVETAPHLDAYGCFEPDGEGVQPAGFDDWHAAARSYLQTHGEVAADHGHGAVVDDVVAALDRRPDAFDGATTPVCCHGWASPEHVAVDGDRVACVVDFEHAIAAPAEYDYWRTIHATFDDHDPARDAFRDGYASVNALPDDLEAREPLYALLNLVYYFESLYVQAQHGPEETQRRAQELAAATRRVLDSLD